MFKKFIRKVIDRLEKAYQDTYGNEIDETNFSNEVNKRKQMNKAKFIRTMAGLTMINHFAEGKPITPDEAESIAKHMFTIAKSRGDLDELNDLKGE